MSGDIKLGITISANAQQARAEVRVTEGDLAKLGAAGAKAGGDAAGGLNKLGDAAKRTGGDMTRLGTDASRAMDRLGASGTAGSQSLVLLEARTRAQAAATAALSSTWAKLGADASRAMDAYSRAGQQGSAALARMEVSAVGAAQGAAGLAGWLSKAAAAGTLFFAVIGGGNALLQTATQFDKIDKALTSVTGSAGASAAQMAFVQDTAKRLGIGLVSTADGYVKLTAAAQGTELQGEKTQQIFTAVAKASAALGLSSEDTSGALLAIGQMMSKGNVQAEELRGQLGERLPGAFQIAARAMGVSTAELQKMLEQGQVVATDFLPRFAAELDKTYANARFDGIQNNINRIGTEWDLLKARMADTLPIKAGVEALAGALAALNKELDKTPLEAAQGRLAEANALGLSGGPNEKRVAQLQAEQSALFRRIGGSGSRFNDSVPDIASVNLAGSLSAGSFNVGASDSFSPGAAFNRAVGLQNTQQAMAGALQTYEQLHAATERAAQGTQKLAGAELAMAKATLAADEAHARRTHNTQALVDILAKQQMAEHGYTEEQARAIAQNKVREEQEKAGLSTSNKAATAAQTLSEKINDIVAGYTKEAGAVGLSAREAAVYEAEQKAIIGLTAQQIEQLKAQPEYWNRLRDAAGQAFDARQAQELDKYVKQLNGSIEDSVALDQQRMALMQSGVVGDALESELALRKKIADVTREMQDKGAGADAIAEEVSKIRSSWSAISGAAADAARKAQDDWKQTSQAIEQGLINALMAGFEKGKSFGQNLKDTLKALFKTLILEPVIRPIANGISQAVSGVVSNVVGSALGNSVSGLFGNGLSGIVGNVAGSALGSVVSDAGGGSPMVSSGGGGMGTIGNIASIGSLVNNATGWGTQALNSAGSTVSGWLGGSSAGAVGATQAAGVQASGAVTSAYTASSGAGSAAAGAAAGGASTLAGAAGVVGAGYGAYNAYKDFSHGNIAGGALNSASAIGAGAAAYAALTVGLAAIPIAGWIALIGLAIAQALGAGKPKPPQSSARVHFDGSTNPGEVLAADSKYGGSKKGAISLASNTGANAINAFNATLGYNPGEFDVLSKIVGTKGQVTGLDGNEAFFKSNRFKLKKVDLAKLGEDFALALAKHRVDRAPDIYTKNAILQSGTWEQLKGELAFIGQVKNFLHPVTQWETDLGKINSQIDALIPHAVQLGFDQAEFEKKRQAAIHGLQNQFRDQLDQLAGRPADVGRQMEALTQRFDDLRQGAAALGIPLSEVDAAFTAAQRNLRNQFLDQLDQFAGRPADMGRQMEALALKFEDLRRGAAALGIPLSEVDAAFTAAQRNLRNQFLDQLDQLAGRPADIGRQMEALSLRFSEMRDGAAALGISVGEVEVAFSKAKDSLVNNVLGGIRQFLAGLDSGSLSTLSPEQIFRNAQGDYGATLLKAQAGDVTAIGELAGKAQTYLEQARAYYASSAGYSAAHDSVVSGLQMVDSSYTARLPQFAAGGLASGWAIVGENGPEVVNFTSPGRVYTAEQTRAALNGDGGGETVAELRAQTAELKAMVRVLSAGMQALEKRLASVDANTASIDTRQRREAAG